MTGISSISTASLSSTDPTSLLLQQQQAAAAAARKAALDAAAKSLNMTTADLQTQLRSGKSLTSSNATGKVHGHGHHGHHAAPPITSADPANDPSALASPTYSVTGSSTTPTTATGTVVDQSA